VDADGGCDLAVMQELHTELHASRSMSTYLPGAPKTVSPKEVC